MTHFYKSFKLSSSNIFSMIPKNPEKMNGEEWIRGLTRLVSDAVEWEGPPLPEESYPGEIREEMIERIFDLLEHVETQNLNVEASVKDPKDAQSWVEGKPRKINTEGLEDALFWAEVEHHEGKPVGMTETMLLFDLQEKVYEVRPPCGPLSCQARKLQLSAAGRLLLYHQKERMLLEEISQLLPPGISLRDFMKIDLDLDSPIPPIPQEDFITKDLIVFAKITGIYRTYKPFFDKLYRHRIYQFIQNVHLNGHDPEKEDIPEQVKNIADCCRKFFEKHGRKPVLASLGCGDAILEKYLMEKGLVDKVIGVDITTRSGRVEREDQFKKILIQKSGLAEEELMQKVIESLALEDADITLFGDSLHHTPHPQAYVKEVLARMSQGYIIISEPFCLGKGTLIRESLFPLDSTEYPESMLGLETHQELINSYIKEGVKVAHGRMIPCTHAGLNDGYYRIYVILEILPAEKASLMETPAWDFKDAEGYSDIVDPIYELVDEPVNIRYPEGASGEDLEKLAEQLVKILVQNDLMMTCVSPLLIQYMGEKRACYTTWDRFAFICVEGDDEGSESVVFDDEKRMQVLQESRMFYQELIRLNDKKTARLILAEARRASLKKFGIEPLNYMESNVLLPACTMLSGGQPVPYVFARVEGMHDEIDTVLKRMDPRMAQTIVAQAAPVSAFLRKIFFGKE